MAVANTSMSHLVCLARNEFENDVLCRPAGPLTRVLAAHHNGTRQRYFTPTGAVRMSASLAAVDASVHFETDDASTPQPLAVILFRPCPSIPSQPA